MSMQRKYIKLRTRFVALKFNEAMSQLIKEYAIYIPLFILVSTFSYSQTEPTGLYLTWQKDPTSTMTIDWHTLPEDHAKPFIYYRQKDRHEWSKEQGNNFDFPNSDRIVNRIELTGLKANTTYHFKFDGFERVYQFTTLPENIDSEPLSFAIGGDTYDRGHWARHIWMERMNRVVMQYQPKFIVWGGDLAYADGRPDQSWRWEGWFDAIKNTLIDKDGKVIPILPTIGNHEVNKSVHSWGKDYEQINALREKSAPFFYSLLAFPGQPGFKTLDIGNYLSLIILDTDHTNPINGIQEKWLQNSLEDRKEIPHVFPVYHVPAYPSHNELDNRSSERVRKYWSPLFDKYNVPWAFEYHDHSYKRTPPIRNGSVHSKGTVYIGDGGWGTQLKQPKDAHNTWYLDTTIRERHAVLISLYRDQRFLRAVNESGQIIDEYPNLFYTPPLSNQISSLTPDGGITLSAEIADRSRGVHIDSDYKGYTENGFAWFEKELDSTFLTWDIPIEKSGHFILFIRYSQEGSQNSQMKFIVNDAVINHNLTFTPTKSWADWEKSSPVRVFLKKGDNTITLQKMGKNIPRIDRLEVLPD